MTVTPSRLALGTVQFGLPYGVTHAGGRVTDAEAKHILTVARAANIAMLDTAAGYGEAEDVLGRIGAHKSFRIVTKTMAAGTSRLEKSDLDRIEVRFMASLAKLQASPVDTVLVHAPADLLMPGGDSLWEQMKSWQSQGLVRRVGISVYDRADLDALLARFSPDVVQLPLNVLDQRLLRDGSITDLGRRGIAIHIRSVFLQGLLLQDPARCPLHMARTRPHLERWSAYCRERQIQPLEAALAFGLGIAEIEHVVIGVHSAAHLGEILDAASAAPPPRGWAAMDWASLAVNDADAVDPRRWLKE